MAVEMAIWRMTDDGPRRLRSSPLHVEQRLEDMLAEDPGMTGIDLLVVGRAGWWEDMDSEDPEVTEMVVLVKWLGTRPLEEAVWEKGLFANQLTACRLRDKHTITTVESAFGLRSGVD